MGGNGKHPKRTKKGLHLFFGQEAKCHHAHLVHRRSLSNHEALAAGDRACHGTPAKRELDMNMKHVYHHIEFTTFNQISCGAWIIMQSNKSPHLKNLH